MCHYGNENRLHLQNKMTVNFMLNVVCCHAAKGDKRVYVCLCNAYRESHVRDAIEKSNSDALTVEELYARLGSGPRCGRCLLYVDDLIKANRAEKSRCSPTGSDRNRALAYASSSPGSI
jgi:bacterioferritin-associated ferredoxin